MSIFPNNKVGQVTGAAYRVSLESSARGACPRRYGACYFTQAYCTLFTHSGFSDSYTIMLLKNRNFTGSFTP
jgi:hypothetical protein